MKPRWITLGAVGLTLWLVGTFGVAYAVVEWRSNDTQVVVEAPIATATQGAAPTFASTQSVCEKLQTDLLIAQTDVAASFIGRQMSDLGC